MKKYDVVIAPPRGVNKFKQTHTLLSLALLAKNYGLTDREFDVLSQLYIDDTRRVAEIIVTRVNERRIPQQKKEFKTRAS